ncbi:unnamed protein product [Tenebrio molitor]|nr:unnamed protein product [Tenebrio molitor]
MNRKGYYSIQIQGVCDHQAQIRDVFLGFPGSVHDSRVLRCSPLFDSLAEKCQNLYLLGDSGYAVLPHLLTPFKDRGQLSRAQINYNGKLSSNKYVIGLLKQKFRQLYHLKLRKLEDMVHFIRACCVLHNMALDDDFPLNEENNEAGNVGIPFLNNDENDPDDRNGVQIRNILEQRRRGERRQ